MLPRSLVSVSCSRCCVAPGSVLWFLIGFSLSYGDDVGGFIGNLDYSLLLNLPLDDCVPRFSRTLPVTAYVTFQMMFALMVPVIITGAWAEKLNFRVRAPRWIV